jgi:DNA repair exonuclease SbcCD ATPase subunit
MDGRKEEVLQAEEAILRLGKESERMDAFNKKLEDVTAQILKAQEEVSGARKEILSFAESSAAMNKRSEELVNSLNSRYEAVETRLRGIDLEITTFRKEVDTFGTTVTQTARNVQELKEYQDAIINKVHIIFGITVIVLVLSITGIVISLII